MKFNAAAALASKLNVIWADCDDKYFVEMYQKASQVVTFTHIIRKNKNLSEKATAGLTAISLEELVAEKEDVCIFLFKPKGFGVVAEDLRKRSFLCDHVANYLPSLCVNTLQEMGFTEYIDYQNNKIICPYKISGSAQFIVNKEADYSGGNVIELGQIGLNGKVTVGFFGKNGYLKIGNSTFHKTDIIISTNGRVQIKDDCMFSHDIVVSQSDQHLIFDLATGRRINECKNIIIGNHVWVGRFAAILGGAEIPDNCIVAQGAITSSKFKNTSCVIAGSPAKEVRSGIIWARDSQKFDYKTFDECKEKQAVKYFTEAEKKQFYEN